MNTLLSFRRVFLFVFVAAGLFISSCETTVDIDIPFEKPQVTLNATFLHNAFPKVRLTYSRHILDTNWEFEPIKTAEVKLITGNETYFLNYNEESGEYSNLQYLVSEDTEYTIEVDLEGYEKVQATEMVPIYVPIHDLVYNGKGQQDAWTSGDDFSLIFNDPVGEHYYEISAYYVRREHYINEYGEEVYYEDNRTIYLEPKNPSYETDFFLDGGIIIDDKLFEGKQAKIDLFTSGNFMELEDRGEIYFVLKNISKSYYDFQSTYGLQDWNDGDPFAQPVQVFSNIENGIGIFMTGNIASEKIETGSGQN
ncbi:MAG: DUF4249 domain-containing protein [Cytophagales bacterium]|uniref:DUF4249 domain-containing protein n=1 Tax=Cyclobacterium marinum TaxID=104 RepID=UPI0030DB8265|nr:DUF4249 domain-containing protein [Cytophagales bacterium]